MNKSYPVSPDLRGLCAAGQFRGYISHVFPDKVRSKGQSLGSFTHWSLCAIAATVYPPIVAIAGIGLSIPFAFGTVMMIIQFFVVWFLFVETKGIPLEQLEIQLGVSSSHPMKSVNIP